jgi:CBS domain containing-hemolysin-like protein
MNRAERSSSEPPPEPDSSLRPAVPAHDGWLERLKAAVGLKGAPSIREEIAEAVASGGKDAGFSAEERAMLANILSLADVRVDDIMVPRADIDAVEVGITLAALLAAFEKSGHSRMPVHRETLDDPVGLVHIKDLMGYIVRAATVGGDSEEGGREGFDLGRVDLSRRLADTDLVRNILFVPPSMPVTALLASMQAARVQLALVIDEYGGTDGLVSLEDVIEMVVGDIEDEHDDDESPKIVPAGEGVYLADARADLDEVSAALGVDLAAGEDGEDVDTIGGLLFSLLGRIPVRGELIKGPAGLEFEILDADPRRIKRLRIAPQRTGGGKPEARRKPRAAGDTA